MSAQLDINTAPDHFVGVNKMVDMHSDQGISMQVGDHMYRKQVVCIHVPVFVTQSTN